MRKMTLLDMVQNILSAMDSDEVNSIGDTVEAQQVAEEIRTTYDELYSNRNIPEFEGLINLESPADETQPHTLRLPEGTHNIKWVKYLNHRNRGHLVDVHYLDPEEFVRRIVDLDHSQYELVNSVLLMPGSTLTYRINAGSVPRYYTILDNDRTLVFDSYDSEFEPYLVSNNAVAWGYQGKEFKMRDDFVPHLDAHLFPHLLAEAKSACFINIKQVSSSKEEQRARRQLVRSQTRLGKAEQREGVLSRNDYSRTRNGRGYSHRGRHGR